MFDLESTKSRNPAPAASPASPKVETKEEGSSGQSHEEIRKPSVPAPLGNVLMASLSPSDSVENSVSLANGDAKLGRALVRLEAEGVNLEIINLLIEAHPDFNPGVGSPGHNGTAGQAEAGKAGAETAGD